MVARENGSEDGVEEVTRAPILYRTCTHTHTLVCPSVPRGTNWDKYILGKEMTGEGCGRTGKWGGEQ